MKRYLSILLIVCLVGLFLPVQVVAGECTSFTEARQYVSTIKPNCMISWGIVGYIIFKNDTSNIPYHNATIIDVYMNIQANGSMHMAVYKTYLNENRSQTGYELMMETNLIAQPIVGFNRSITLPYLNGHVSFDDGIHLWVPSMVVLVTNLENYTISLVLTTISYWDVYLAEDDVVSTTNETETIETTEPISTTSNVVVGGDTPSIWTIIMGTIVIGEFVIMMILGRLIMCQRREMR